MFRKSTLLAAAPGFAAMSTNFGRFAVAVSVSAVVLGASAPTYARGFAAGGPSLAHVGVSSSVGPGSRGVLGQAQAVTVGPAPQHIYPYPVKVIEARPGYRYGPSHKRIPAPCFGSEPCQVPY
jgi:hypothetical protein